MNEPVIFQAWMEEGFSDLSLSLLNYLLLIGSERGGCYCFHQTPMTSINPLVSQMTLFKLVRSQNKIESHELRKDIGGGGWVGGPDGREKREGEEGENQNILQYKHEIVI